MKTNAQAKQDKHSSSEAKAKNQASEGGILQAYKNGSTQLAEDEEPVQRQENKTGLPDNLKSGVENLSGHSLDDVKVHYGSSKPAELQAHAYAQGTDIHVAPGQEKHLPHEAWHVVQQKQGRVKPTKQLKGTTNINDDTGLEKEADVMGAKAIQFAGNSTLTSETNTQKVTNSDSIQLRQIDEADDFANLGIHDTNETFSVVGLFGKDNAGWYADNTLHAAANKTAAIGKIAKRAGDIGQNTQALGKKETKKGLKAGEANGIYASKANHNKSDVNAIDPFTHGSYCQIGEEDYLVLMYQHMHDFDGYVTGIEEGKIGEDKEFVRNFAKNMTYGDQKATASVADAPGTYSNLHEKTGSKVLNTIAGSSGKGKADAITKLAGEGARFVWVRDNITTITDELQYDEVPSVDGKPDLSIRFKDLWCVWKDWFNGAYNISNATINEKLRAKADAAPISKEAKKRMLFDYKSYKDYIKG